MKLRSRRAAIVAAVGVAIAGTAVAVVPMAASSAAAACFEAWNSSKVYTNGMSVSYQSKNYTAKWWTQGEIPANSGQWGVWADKGPCETGGTPPTTPPVTTPPTTRPPTTAPTNP